jgi:hypothetical protein
LGGRPPQLASIPRPERLFQVRLGSSHHAPDRRSEDLVVEFLTDAGEWQPQELSLTMPGVRLYLISLLLCQHIPLIATAREKGIPLLWGSPDFVDTDQGFTGVSVGAAMNSCS